MNIMRHCLWVILLFLCLMPATASAASSDWHVTTGGRIRLLVSEPATGAEDITGVLQIALEPGWKTYWRDPGSAGIPPQIDIRMTSGISGVSIGFPPPQRFTDDYGTWAGYKHDVGLALTFSRNSTALPQTVIADVFVGICETICVPVQARLEVDLSTAQSDAETVLAIAAAFAAIPGRADSDFGITGSKLDGNLITVTANIPAKAANPELFVENTGGWYLGVPDAASRDGVNVVFAVPVVDRPVETAVDVPAFSYTLNTGLGAVTGTMPVTVTAPQ